MNNANQVNDNHGFVDVNGHFRNADFPTGAPAAPPVDQLLGVNDSDVAVGFYTDANGNNHGYEYNAGSGRFSTVTEPGVTSLTAAAHQRPRPRGRLLHQPRHRQHRRVPQGRATAVHRPGRPRRVRHDRRSA